MKKLIQNLEIQTVLVEIHSILSDYRKQGIPILNIK